MEYDITKQAKMWAECANFVWHKWFEPLDEGWHEFLDVDDELLAAFVCNLLQRGITLQELTRNTVCIFEENVEREFNFVVHNRGGDYSSPREVKLDAGTPYPVIHFDGAGLFEDGTAHMEVKYNKKGGVCLPLNTDLNFRLIYTLNE